MNPSMINNMLNISKQAREKAYAPYSKFYVGACILAANGKLYAGCNVENASYGLTACAEAGAITAMINDGQQQIKAITVIGTGDVLCTPCGGCRQRIREFAQPETIIHCCNNDGPQLSMSIQELLPQYFGPNHLHKMETINDAS